MSDATLAALEAALQAHVSDMLSDSPNVLVAGYACKVHVLDFDGDTKESKYLFIRPPLQAYHETYGLLVTAIDDFVDH